MAKSYEPDVFEFSVLGLPNFDEISVLWHGDVLVYYHGEEEKESRPSQKAWELFWQVLDRIGAWEWQGKYEDHNILDGEHWSLTIYYNGKAINCAGSNAYPPGFGEFRWGVNWLVNKVIEKLRSDE
jgi:hypothetical protein